MNCQCILDQEEEPEFASMGTIAIIWCPLHAAAPDLLEIAKEIQFESNRNCLGPVIRKALDAAIKKATEAS